MAPRARLLRGLSFALVFAGCSSSGNEPPLPPSPHPPGGELAGDAASSLTNAPNATAPSTERPSPAPPAPSQGPVEVTREDRRPLPPTLRPRVTFTTPGNNRTLRENRAEVRLAVRDWTDVPGASGRQHLHLVLDEGPTLEVPPPVGDAAWRWQLSNLPEGTHTLRAFLAWHDHQAVAAEGAFASVTFHVGRPTPGSTPAPTGPQPSRTDSGSRRSGTAPAPPAPPPMLSLSSPPDAVRGAEAERVLLDFHLANVPPDAVGPQGYRVRAVLDGSAPRELTEWAPQRVQGLTDGAHTISLELLGNDGAVVPGPFHRVERRFTVDRRP